MIEEKMAFRWDAPRDANLLRSREWLVTNGLGGYASGTLLGEPSRRYHGLFVPHLIAPHGRTVLIPRLDTFALANGRFIHLTGAEYKDGRTDSEGPQFLKEFRLSWQIPTWTYSFPASALQKRIFMPHGQNTACVEYSVLWGEPLTLRLRPFITFRGHDERLGGSFESLALQSDGDRYWTRLGEHDLELRLRFKPGSARYVPEPLVSSDVFYRWERERGLDDVEDLSSPGYFELVLESGQTASFLASVEPWEKLEEDGTSLIESEKRRLAELVSRAPASVKNTWAEQLVLAADQFIVLPGPRPEPHPLAKIAGCPVRTIVAGYHWFTDWGRDTMISLEGLTLCTGRTEEARMILRTFAGYMKNGLIPNHFPEGHDSAVYNTMDATLWYFHALDRYHQFTGDKDTLSAIFPVLEEALAAHWKGTDFGIGADPEDGLLRGGAPGYALTWMDAKADDWVVTPRRGKPVEIQALWYNAHRLMEEWERILRPEKGKVSLYGAASGRIFDSFNRQFWYEKGQYLYDVIGGEGGPDRRFRPNQIFSLSLKHPVLEPGRWRAVFDGIKKWLLTPCGLRTLSPEDLDYRPIYSGNRKQRDGVYHQGLVWPWLIGAYHDAMERVFPDGPLDGAWLEAARHHLKDGCIGTLCEIFDAEPPHRERGCIAQAWSVAEMLRCFVNLKRKKEAAPAGAATSVS